MYRYAITIDGIRVDHFDVEELLDQGQVQDKRREYAAEYGVCMTGLHVQRIHPTHHDEGVSGPKERIYTK